MCKNLAFIALLASLFCSHAALLADSHPYARFPYLYTMPENYNHIEIVRYNFAPDILSNQEIYQAIYTLCNNYKRILNWPQITLHIQPKILLFGKQSAFKSYQKKSLHKVIANFGYFSPKQDEAVIYGQSSLHTLNTILHEVAHSIHAARGLHMPDWLNEGLAEYMAAISLQGGLLQARKKQFKKYYARTKQTPSLEHFTTHNYFSLPTTPAKEISSYYDMALSITQFILEKKAHTFINLLEQLENAPIHTQPDMSQFIISSLNQNNQKNFQQQWQTWLSHSDIAQVAP